MGRVIRHRHDWGAVLLLDVRFQQKRNQQQLSKWQGPLPCTAHLLEPAGTELLAAAQQGSRGMCTRRGASSLAPAQLVMRLLNPDKTADQAAPAGSEALCSLHQRTRKPCRTWLLLWSATRLQKPRSHIPAQPRLCPPRLHRKQASIAVDLSLSCAVIHLFPAATSGEVIAWHLRFQCLSGCLLVSQSCQQQEPAWASGLLCCHIPSSHVADTLIYHMTARQTQAINFRCAETRQCLETHRKQLTLGRMWHGIIDTDSPAAKGPQTSRSKPAAGQGKGKDKPRKGPPNPNAAPGRPFLTPVQPPQPPGTLGFSTEPHAPARLQSLSPLQPGDSAQLSLGTVTLAQPPCPSSHPPGTSVAHQHLPHRPDLEAAADHASSAHGFVSAAALPVCGGERQKMAGTSSTAPSAAHMGQEGLRQCMDSFAGCSGRSSLGQVAGREQHFVSHQGQQMAGTSGSVPSAPLIRQQDPQQCADSSAGCSGRSSMGQMAGGEQPCFSNLGHTASGSAAAAAAAAAAAPAFVDLAAAVVLPHAELAAAAGPWVAQDVQACCAHLSTLRDCGHQVQISPPAAQSLPDCMSAVQQYKAFEQSTRMHADDAQIGAHLAALQGCTMRIGP